MPLFNRKDKHPKAKKAAVEESTITWRAVDFFDIQAQSETQFRKFFLQRLADICTRSKDSLAAEQQDNVAAASANLCYDVLVSNIERQRTQFEDDKSRLGDALERLRSNLTKQHNRRIGDIETRHQDAIYWKNKALDEYDKGDKIKTQQIKTLYGDLARAQKALEESERIASQNNKAAQRLEAVANERSKEISRLQRVISDRDTELEAHKGSIALQNQQLHNQATVIAQRDQEIVQWKADLSYAQKDYENRLHASSQAANIEKVMLESNQQRTLETLQEDHSQEVSQLTKEHRDNMNRLKQELEQSTLEYQDSAMRQTLEHQNLVRELEQGHTATVLEIEDKNKKHIDRLSKEYAHATETLHSDRQDLNTALLTRDLETYQGAMFQTHNLPRKADTQIRDNFSEVQQLVESLGRLTWKKDHTMWNEQLLEKLGRQHVEKELRRAILQDAVWTILFYRVFSSPFRIFGAAGLQLEQQWNEHCSKDAITKNGTYRWPKAGIGVERWRYCTMMSAREALTIGLSQYDPRVELKQGFRDSQQSLISNLKDTLSDFVDLAPSDIQTIERLCKKVFLLWLDFTMHRCRIVVLLKDTEAKSTKDKAVRAQKDLLTFTILPLVGRYGNVKGLELETFYTIDGCAGESLVIPEES